MREEERRKFLLPFIEEKREREREKEENIYNKIFVEITSLITLTQRISFEVNKVIKITSERTRMKRKENKKKK